jgi:small subunit ribosomal protein S7
MRGKSAQIRQVLPDYKYGNVLVSKLVNYVMKDGKKTTAEKIVYDALEIVSKKTKQDPIAVFDEAMKNIMPSVEIKSRRVGGANYQIPTPVRSERRVALAYRWMLESARSKKGKPMAQKLANEIISASQGEGDAVKKKLDVQRMAEANKAFAHFAKR